MGEIATVLTLLLFAVVMVAVPLYFTLSIYAEARDMTHSIQGLWVTKEDYLPTFLNEKLSEAHVYLMNDGFIWLDARLKNATGLTFAVLNSTAASVFNRYK